VAAAGKWKLYESAIEYLADGTHDLDDTTNWKMALFLSTSNCNTLSTGTGVYGDLTNEHANGNGYTTGGVALSGFTTGLSGDTAYIDWTSDPSWAASSITARGALIYNATQSNKAVAVLDFGADITSTNGTFTVQLPAAGATATIRVA